MKAQKAQTTSLVRFDRRHLRGREGLIGVDEVGRGSLAGPVVAGAAFVSKNCYKSGWICKAGQWINDSKQLSGKERATLVLDCRRRIEDGSIIIALGEAGVEEIERFNILGATMLAMRRAICGLGEREWLLEQKILLDGKPMKHLEYRHESVVKGDATSFAIALASIFAKEHRDALMRKLGEQFSGYGFENNAGYGTQAHRAAIKAIGPSEIHRKLFLRKILHESEFGKKFSQTELY